MVRDGNSWHEREDGERGGSGAQAVGYEVAAGKHTDDVHTRSIVCAGDLQVV